MIYDQHPYWHVRSVVSQIDNLSSISFSHYSYTRETIEDLRSTWRISRSQFLDPVIINNIILSTPRGCELTINSAVQLLDGSERHFALIDMATSSRAHLDKLRNFLGENFYRSVTWFKSGRSFHGYGSELLTEKTWVQFMGLLLLANKPRMEPTVDPRWIGHRLLAGYSALRWTKNTSQYLIPPMRLD